MSWWVLPTTADIGIIVFAKSASHLMEECAKGLQSIVMSDQAEKKLGSHIRHTSQWRIDAVPNREDLTLVRWLEEILYQCEVEGRFLVDCQIRIDDCELESQVSWVDSNLIEREVEIKAVTRHELQCRAVSNGELIHGVGNIPDFEGPGWFGQIIFDI